MTLAAPSMHCFVEWLWAPGRKPPRAGKYVVSVHCGHGLCYLSTRSYNPTYANDDGWCLMADGERVEYWLAGLLMPEELVSGLNLGEGLNKANDAVPSGRNE